MNACIYAYRYVHIHGCKHMYVCICLYVHSHGHIMCMQVYFRHTYMLCMHPYIYIIYHGVTYSRSIEKGVMSAVYTTHSIPVASWAIALLGLLLHTPTCTSECLPLFFKNPFMTMYNLCLPLYVCIYNYVRSR